MAILATLTACGGPRPPAALRRAPEVVVARPVVVAELPDHLGTSRWRHPGLESLAVSRDGRRLLTSAGYGDALLWDAKTGVVLHRFAGAAGADVALAADGKIVARIDHPIMGEGRELEVVAATGEVRTTMSAGGRVSHLALDATGEALVVGTKSGGIELYDTATGRAAWRVTGHPGEVTAIAFAGRDLVVSAGEQGGVGLWRRSDGGRAGILPAAGSAITALAVTPAGDLIATVDSSGEVRVIATGSGAVRDSFATGSSYQISGLALAPGGRRLVTGSHGGELILWAPDTGKRVARLIEHGLGATAVAMTGDGTIYGGATAGAIRKWSAAGTEVALEPRGHLAAVADLAVAGPDRLVVASGGREAVIWDLEQRREVTRLGPHGDVVRVVAAAAGRVATGGYDQQIRIWDLTTGRLLGRRFGHEGAVTALAFSPDGAWLLSGGRDGLVTLQRSDLSAFEFDRHEDDNAITAAAWSPAGDLVVYGDSFGSLVMIEPASRRVVARIDDSYPDAVSWIGFSPDGHSFATTAGDTLRIYDTSSAALRITLTASGFSMARAAWSPRRDEIGLADSDGNLWLVDPESGEILCHITRATDKFVAVAYTSDGDTLLASRRDTTIALWSVARDLRGRAVDQSESDQDDALEVVVGPPSPSRRIPAPPCPAPGADSRGDPLPPCASQRLGSLRLRADDDIDTLAISTGSGILAVAADDNETIQVWRLDDGARLLDLWGSEIGNGPLALVGERGLIAADSIFSRVRHWDLTSGRKLGVAEIRASALATTADGTTLAVADRAGNIRLWDVAAWRERRRWKSPLELVADTLVFSPDGRRLAAACDGYTELYDVATGAAIDFAEDVEPYGVPGFTRSGQLVLAGDVAASIRADDGTLTEYPYGLPRGFDPGEVGFSAAGSVLVAGTDMVAVWDPARPAAPARVVAVGRFDRVAGGDDGDTLIVVRQLAIARWSLRTGKPVLDPPGHEHWVRWVGATADRGFTFDGTTIREWALDSGRLVGERPGGSAVAVASTGAALAISSQKRVIIHDLVRGGRRELAIRDGGFASRIALSADGRYLLATEDETKVAVSLYDIKRRRRLRSFGSRGDGWIDQIALSADGGLVAWADGTSLQLYRADGSKVATLDHGEGISAIAFASDRATLATADERGTIRLWATATGAALATLEGHRSMVSALAFAPDNRRLASGDLYGELWVWDLAGGAPLARIPGHRNMITALAFAGERGRLISGSWDATALVWDLATMETAPAEQ